MLDCASPAPFHSCADRFSTSGGVSPTDEPSLCIWPFTGQEREFSYKRKNGSGSACLDRFIQAQGFA